MLGKLKNVAGAEIEDRRDDAVGIAVGVQRLQPFEVGVEIFLLVQILVVGLNDSGVLGAIQAAEQLGRADDIIGWGQDGSFITGKNVDPHLAGSVFYFLEGYAVYALRDGIDPIAAGKTPPAARQVFRGWMFAASPGLNPFQHPVYDAWLIACKAAGPSTPAPKT